MKRIAFCGLLLTFALITNGVGQTKTKRTKSPAAAAAGIRRIDFKNYNYGRLCGVRDDSWVALPEVDLVLRRGHQKYDEGEKDYADLGSVKYVDFDGDGKEEAFVVIKGSTSTAAGDAFLSAYVFAYQNGAARQIWSKCNENSTAVLRGRSILFTYNEYVGEDAHCCPSYLTTNTYGWKNSAIALISKKRKPNR
ncbi:MAG TPA: hypothetical protein VM934_06280 [Pyrinomonadaceae bacterium]|nr:hypothetical protein [Pyrinomonadaceae bacterium]